MFPASDCPTKLKLNISLRGETSHPEFDFVGSARPSPGLALSQSWN